MPKEYNVIFKKEFIIYLAFAIVYSIIFLFCTFPERTIKEIIDELLWLLMFYIAPIFGWIINIIFNFWKINNKKAKLITKILFNIFAIIYTALITFLIMVVLTLAASIRDM